MSPDPALASRTSCRRPPRGSEMSSHTFRLLGGLGLLCSVSAAAPVWLGRFSCLFRKNEDAFQVVAPKPGAESFRIRSASGIGDATITCREGTWPESVSVLFAGMQYLESFGMEGNGV